MAAGSPTLFRGLANWAKDDMAGVAWRPRGKLWGRVLTTCLDSDKRVGLSLSHETPVLPETSKRLAG